MQTTITVTLDGRILVQQRGSIVELVSSVETGAVIGEMISALRLQAVMLADIEKQGVSTDERQGI